MQDREEKKGSDVSGNAEVVIRASRRRLYLLAGFILLPWILLGLSIMRGPGGSATEVLSGGILPAGRLVAFAHKGPWGDLRTVRVTTAPQEETILKYLDYPVPVWHFKGFSADQMHALIAEAGLSLEQKDMLLKNLKWELQGEGCTIEPPDKLVLSLSPEQRGILYGALSLFQENKYQYEPFRFRADLEKDWFIGSGVPHETIGHVRKLLYLRGKAMLFSDPHLVVPALPSRAERIQLLKMLVRRSTMMVTINIGKDSDIDALVEYWAGRGGRSKDIKSLLESAARIPGGQDIDIIHLLPPFARKRIYTYPKPTGDAEAGVAFDCHWTSMNFWNDPPDNQLASNDFAIRSIETEFERVSGDLKFGDVLLFMKSEKEIIHSAVYIADDIIFTKNGPGMHSPFIFMSLDTLTLDYSANIDLKIVGIRRKKVDSLQQQ